MALIAALIANVDLGTLPLIAAMTVSGFCYGVMMPSRDMIVRDITPHGSFGKVFGFVTTGFNIGGIIAPLIFGAIMDHASPRLVFVGVAIFSLIAVATVATLPKRAA
jgi:MFS family permease